MFGRQWEAKYRAPEDEHAWWNDHISSPSSPWDQESKAPMVLLRGDRP